MNILFLSHFFYPHIGGVEKHVMEISKSLVVSGHSVTVLTRKFDSKLKNDEIVSGIKIIRFPYPSSKFFGLLVIWSWLFRNRNLLKKADIIHCHDVFIWYLPFRFFYPKKKVFTTIHGLEWNNPFTISGIWQKKLAVKLSKGTIGVGSFLEKYLGIRFDLIVYGATSKSRHSKVKNKIKNSIIFLGRLERDTGVLKFIKYLEKNRNLNAEFVGDGSLKSVCKKYGKVHGFTDPTPFLKKAEYVVPGGYLAYVEAKSFGCKIMTYPPDELKKVYWQGIKKVDKFPTWDALASQYVGLWKTEIKIR
jgi:glycosyltransferase involved in cell wall biosynthesis